MGAASLFNQQKLERVMSEHQHGSMDITQHERAFAGFLRISTRVTIVIIAALVFLAIFNS